MKFGTSQRRLGALRLLPTFRLLFELALVATILGGGIWIARHPKKDRAEPAQSGIVLNHDHVVVVKTSPGGSPNFSFLILTYRDGALVDLLGHDSGLTNAKRQVKFNEPVETYYFTLQVPDAGDISADELRHAISCIIRAVPEGKKCYIEVYLL